MSEHEKFGRRDFIRIAVSASGGMLLSFNLPQINLAAENVRDHKLTVFVEIGTDNSVKITAPLPEIGQGVRTALPLILADELDAGWETVKVVQAQANEIYGGMSVGGSFSIAGYYDAMRRAGALARELLISAAAKRLNVARENLSTQDNRVTDKTKNRSLTYGELAEDAAKMPRPEEIPLKDAKDFKLIGKSVKRVDIEEIVTGRAVYGYDVEVPGMLYAMIERCPVDGGTVGKFDPGRALKVPGVKKVFELKPLTVNGQKYGAIRGGVVVVADGFWSALKGREALEIVWDEGENAKFGTDELRKRFRALKGEAGQKTIYKKGDAAKSFETAAKTVEAEYELPILAHGCLEPMNFTADVRAGYCRLWGPTQAPRNIQNLVAEMLEIPAEKVEVNLTLAGGGFGRRLAYDYAMEAAAVSKEVGKPVKLVWTRPDSTRHDYFRPPSYHFMKAALDEKNELTAWHHHIATASLLRNITTGDVQYPELYDVTGAADFPYEVGNLLVEYTPVEVGLQMGSWRSVSHSFNVFAVNSFLDEIARAAGIDPLQFHLKLLGKPRDAEIELALPGSRGKPNWNTGRLANVLKLAAEKGGWGKPLPKGRGRGIAVCFFKKTYVAHVAEVSVSSAAKLKIHRLITAIDCGRVINPDGVLAQVEGAAMDGVATVTKWEITCKNGRVEQSTFRDFPLLTIDEAPPLEVYIVPSEEHPAGTGEPPYPAVAPAITNAIFAATGKRIRRLPFVFQ
jgi:isoquinoline 1-oxidoreductase subunit beta